MAVANAKRYRESSETKSENEPGLDNVARFSKTIYLPFWILVRLRRLDLDWSDPPPERGTADNIGRARASRAGYSRRSTDFVLQAFEYSRRIALLGFSSKRAPIEGKFERFFRAVNITPQGRRTPSRGTLTKSNIGHFMVGEHGTTSIRHFKVGRNVAVGHVGRDGTGDTGRCT